MKKVLLLATAALLITSVTFAHPGKKKKCSRKGKACCHKTTKSCCNKKAATVSM